MTRGTLRGGGSLIRAVSMALVALLCASAAPATAIARVPVAQSGAVPQAARPAQAGRGGLVDLVRGPQLRVTAPRRVSPGEPVLVTVRAHDVRDLAGYEMLLTYDTDVAEFGGVYGIPDALAGTGRQSLPLGPVEVDEGVWFGMVSCPFRECARARGTRHAAGARGDVTLGHVWLLPRRSGRFAVRVAAARLVDSRGRAITVRVPVRSLSVRAGRIRGAVPTFGAPAPAARLGTGRIDRAVVPEVTGDGRVTYADLMELVIRWGSARQDATPCGERRPLDPSGDGCTDVTDAQLAAAGVVAPRAGRARIGVAATPAAGELTFSVGSTGDQADASPGNGTCLTSAGTCTLRAAIAEANLHAGPDLIAFAIAGSGVHRIVISSALPTLNDLTGGTTIDGYTESGASPNSSPTLSDAALRVEVVGSGSGSFDGLFITSGGNVIRGIAWSNLRVIIGIRGVAADANRIVGNFIGTDAAGTFDDAYLSGAQGVLLDQGASSNVVGSPDPADRNVITGNANNAIRTWNELSDHNIIRNNLIGLRPTGSPQGNGAHGIDINSGSSYNLIGGTDPYQRNVVSANYGEGIEISHGTLTVGNRVVGNYVGTDVSGNGGAGQGFGNGTYGIHIEDGVSNVLVADNVVGNNGYRTDTQGGGIGILGVHTEGARVRDNRVGIGIGGAPLRNDENGVVVFFNARNNVIGPANVIAHNPTGVEINANPNDFNTITRNSIFANEYLGIDLTKGTGVTINDGTADSDSGANDQLNFPVITAATIAVASGTACAGCTVEIFVADPNPLDIGGGSYGQGRTFVGSGVAAANRSFSISLGGVSTGDRLTATATDAQGNTSEFGLNVSVPTGAPPTPDPTAPPHDPSVLASDSFSRTAADTWGRADVGGVYGTFYCTFWDMDVTGSAATVLNPGPAGTDTCSTQPEVTLGKWRGGFLNDVSSRDVDLRIKVRSSKAAVGDNQNVYLTARRWSGGTEYRGLFRFDPAGQVWVQPVGLVANAATSLGVNTRASGVTHAADTDVWLRMQVTGAYPTTIRLKAWNAGSSEPSGWTSTTTDGNGQLQQAGAVGVVSLLAGATTNGPVRFTFDDLLVTSLDPPTADFSWVQQESPSLTVAFTDTTVGNATAWSWDFGDGATGSGRTPSHTYESPGSYQVTLIASGPDGSDAETRTVSVVGSQLVADFTSSQVPGTYRVDFTDASSGGPSGWAWDFGDGATGSNPIPFHSYAGPGSYAVTLTVSNGSGSDSETRTVTVAAVPAPVAAFTATPGTGLSVDFADASTGGTPTAWSWDFGDGATGSNPNPFHTYAAPGTFTVSLSVSNAGGTDSATSPVTVLPDAPVADFAWTQDASSLRVGFTDTSGGGAPDTWSWDFGDGATGSNPNPFHTYAAPGTFTVTLSVSNAAGSDSRTRTVTVTAPTILAQDDFGRTTTDTWGGADAGGSYSYVGAAADYDVTGGAGTIRIGSASTGRGAFLMGVSARDVELAFDVSVDKVPASGSGVYVYGVARRLDASNDYRAKVRVQPNGQVRLSASRLLAGSEATIGSEYIVPGLTYTAGTTLHVRARITGASPTRLRLRVWTGGSEPSAWQVDVTDASATLQVLGGAGLRAHVSGSTGNVPITFAFDELLVTPQ